MAEDVAKRQRQLGLSTIESETAALLKAEDQRYSIEKNAAEAINALKQKAAAEEHRPAEGLTDLNVLGAEHQKRAADITGRSAEDLKKEADEQQHVIDEIAAHQREAYEKLAEEGQKAVQKIDKETVEGAEKTAEATERAELSHASRVYATSKQLIEAQFHLKKSPSSRRLRY
jgi:hypothetical protein